MITKTLAYRFVFLINWYHKLVLCCWHYVILCNWYLASLPSSFSDIQESSDRNQALVIGLASFFRFIGMSPQKSTSLERTSSFMAKDKRAFMRMPKSSKKVCV